MGMFRSFAVQQYPVHRMILPEKAIYFFERPRGHGSRCGRAPKPLNSPGFPDSEPDGLHFFDLCPGRAPPWSARIYNRHSHRYPRPLDEPGAFSKSCLRAFQNQKLKPLVLVVHRHAPLLVVVRNVQLIRWPSTTH
jgi:hypothetical protein